MNCIPHRNTLVDLARGGRIDPRTALHLDSCEACREFLDSQRKLSHSMRGLASSSVAELPAGLERELLAEFDAVRSVRPRWTAWITAGAFAMAAVAMVAIVLIRTANNPAPAPISPVAKNQPTQSVPAESPLVAVARPVTVPPQPLRPRPQSSPRRAAQEETVQEASFVAIPWTTPIMPDERTDIVRMDVPVASLIAAGFPMRVQDMSANASADFLVGEDGRARAVRLISVADTSLNRSFK